MDLASSIEVLCAGLSQVHAFKQGIRVARHGWHGGAEKPDCVEVTLRELCELLLFDPEANTLDLRRMPATVAPPLREFY